jgi:predicted GNAT family acetyltransferase
MNISVEQDENSKRFSLLVDGKEGGYLTYEIYDGCLDIQHTVVSSLYQGQGLGRILLDNAKEYAGKNDLKIVPTCSYAKKMLK